MTETKVLASFDHCGIPLPQPAAEKEATTLKAALPEKSPVPKTQMVMIVDEDTALAEELKKILTLRDLQVETLNDVEHIVKIAEEKQPGIIFLDMKMRGKSGFQVADDLKQFSATSAIPIIAMTGHYTQSQHRKFMMSLGISDCIIKPFDPIEVILKIQQFMPNGRKGEEMPNGNELA